MRHPIDEQLRRYAQGVVSGVNPVTAAEASITRLDAVTERQRPAWLVAGVAVGATLLVGVALAMVIPRFRSEQAEPIPVATTATPGTTTTSTTAPPGTVPSAAIPASPLPEPIADWAVGDHNLEGLHSAAELLVVAVNRLPAAVAAQDDFTGEWIEKAPTDVEVSDLLDAALVIGNRARRVFEDPEFVTLSPAQRSSLDALTGLLDEDLDASLGELTDTRSKEEALAFLSGGGDNPAPRQIVDGIVAHVDTVFSAPPDPNAVPVGVCPRPALLPDWARNVPLYEAFHASATDLIDAVNRLPASLPDEEVLEEGWTTRAPTVEPTTEILAAAGRVAADASVILFDLGYEWDDVYEAWIPPAETTDLKGAIYLEILSGRTDTSDIIQGTITEAVMTVALDFVDDFRSREAVLQFLLTGEPTEGQPCYEATELVGIADKVFNPPDGIDGPQTQGTCPLPNPIPDGLADQQSLADLREALTLLSEAVNRLPSVTAGVADFSAGWTDRPPIDTTMEEVRNAAMDVIMHASDILRNVGFTGDPITGWTYPDGMVPSSAIVRVEEITMSGFAMDDSLSELDRQRSLEQAMDFLANGRMSAAPCGTASWAVAMWNEAVEAWDTSP